MTAGVSKRQLARLLGVSDTAVRKAEKAGRIKVGADGLFDPVEARRAWGASTDPTRTRVRAPANHSAHLPAVAAIRTEQDAVDAITLIRRVLSEEGADSAGTIDFGMARTAETILKARERELKMAERRKQLVPMAKVTEHVAKAFIGFRQSVQRLPSRHVAAIAAEVGCDPGRLDAALSKAIASELDVLSTPVVRA
jgi:hypothetical protein